MASADEVRDAIYDDLANGAIEEQLADRRIRRYNANERIDALDKLTASDSIAARGPFRKVGFKGRSV
jgi:hypothetical protein